MSPKFVLSMIALVLGGVALRIAYEAHKPRIGTRVLFVGNSNTFVDKAAMQTRCASGRLAGSTACRSASD